MIIRHLEELSLSAWPSLQTIYYDGWLLRFANGYTKRANSVNALYPSTLPVDQKIDHCIKTYHDRGITPVFRLTETSTPDDLDKSLAARGFLAIDETDVQFLDINNIDSQSIPDVSFRRLGLDDWLPHYCKLSRMGFEDHQDHKQILKTIPSKRIYSVLIQQNEIVACGLGVLEGNAIGLFDLVTDPARRKNGFGTFLVSKLLHFGKENGAHFAFLQVMKSNINARRVYEKIGFTTKYTYWYRTCDRNQD